MVRLPYIDPELIRQHVPQDAELPRQLFVRRIGYENGLVRNVEMTTSQGDLYNFHPMRKTEGIVGYLVSRPKESGASPSITTTSRTSAPSVLETIFGAETKAKIQDLQAKRLLIDCAHVDL